MFDSRLAIILKILSCTSFSNINACGILLVSYFICSHPGALRGDDLLLQFSEKDHCKNEWSGTAFTIST